MKIIDFFDKANNLDLKVVEKQLSSKGWTNIQIQLGVSRYKCFLYLKSLYPEMPLVPTLQIDIVWHTHILSNVIKYTQDSNYLLGYILNHCSAISEEQNKETHKICGQAFNTTKIAFEQHFGINISENISSHVTGCTDIPINIKPAACADIPINPKCLL